MAVSYKKKAKESWIDVQCQDFEYNLRNNNSKKAYQLVKTLTSTKQGKTNTIPDKDGNCLTETNDILKEVDRILCGILQPHSCS